MAFRQPTAYHQPQRLYTAPEETQSSRQAPSSQRLDESQEWVLFSPNTESVTDRTRSTFTDRTHGRSQVSEYSRGTAARTAHSFAYGDGSGHTEVIDEDEDLEDEAERDEAEDAEDGELDSLDSHLPAFRAEGYRPPRDQGPFDPAESSVLPTHDGLGSFRIDRTMMGENVQEHLYSFEQYNPRRVKRRRESLELGQFELENEAAVEDARTRRIEAWRMEQSRLLLEEIQKATRRRKLSMSTARQSVLDEDEDEMATMGSIETPREMQSQIDDDAEDTSATGESEGFWTRITRRVIEDLIGIDDRLLSIIFGEALPDDDDLSTTPPATQPARNGATTMSEMMDGDSWELKLLERISRELGVLVNQISEHPGAFSTYLRTQQQIPPYAGLPAIPESVKDTPADASLHSTVPEPQFQPTISIPIPNTDSSQRPDALEPGPSNQPVPESSRLDIEREAWEKELDITMVFRYLRSRFTSRPFSPTNPTAQTGHLATASTTESAARAARVRQQHPLVNRARPTVERRSGIKTSVSVSIPASSPMAATALHRRGSSSCASQSTKVSARRNSGSSRHYWDIGGSIGSSSLVVATGAMGSWGEV